MVFVYIVECLDGAYYVGSTNNLEKRIGEHNAGIDRGSFTYKRRPVRLRFSEGFENPFDAVNAERRIKGWSRKKKEALFDRDWKRISELAKGGE